MKISMIGSGRWGTFITWYLDSIGHTVKLYGPADTPHMQALLATRSNGTVTLPESVKLVCDIHALADADLIGISVPSYRLTIEKTAEFTQLLKDAAEYLEAVLS